MSQDRLNLLDYYTLLGVDRSADVREIKRAFRRFARKYHPDRFAGATADELDRAQQIYRRGGEAQRILCSPEDRKHYDEVLAEGTVRLTSEERDRRAREQNAKPIENQGPVIRSQAALAYYEKAGEAARTGQWRTAWRLLKEALDKEPGNPILTKRIKQVEARIRANRGGRR